MNPTSNTNSNNMNGEEKPRHKFANPKGGMTLYDEGNVIPAVFKDFVAKIASKVVKGQFSDMLKISSPSFIHCPLTYTEGASMDLSYAPKLLTKAAEVDDPIERLKLIISMYVGGSHINPE